MLHTRSTAHTEPSFNVRPSERHTKTFFFFEIARLIANSFEGRGMWAVVVLACISLCVEVVRRFVFNVHGQRDELRARIAAQREQVREFNPQSEYGKQVMLPLSAKPWLSRCVAPAWRVLFLCAFEFSHTRVCVAAKYIRADRELKRMQEELQNMGEAQVPLWIRALSYAPYVFVVAYSVLYAPLLGVDSDGEAALHAAWWWPLSSVVSSPFVVGLVCAYVAQRSASVIVHQRR